MDTLRAFIAVPLPEAVKTALGEVGRVLSSQIPRQAVRWVKPDRMHLTLRFLGETPLSSLPAIAAGLDEIVAEKSPLLLYLGQLGCFPSSARPRVIWAGTTGNEEALQRLKREIDELLQPMGWQPETRPFRAHLTLGRVKESGKLKGVVWNAELEPLPVPVTEIQLIESELLPAGPRYTIRHTSRLGGA